MYVKVDYSTEAKKNPRTNMAGQYAIYTKRHWWSKSIERGTYADLNLCIRDAQKLIELPKYYNNNENNRRKSKSL